MDIVETSKELSSKFEGLLETMKWDSVMVTNDYLSKRLDNMIPDVLQDMYEDFPFFIAGGAITSLFTNSEVNDLDLYLRDKDSLLEFAYELQNIATIVSVTDKSILVQHSGQLINVILMDVFPEPKDIFKAFDFTICMGAYDFKSKTFHMHKDFMMHNSQRMLVFNPETRFPLMSALRVAKYEERGYKISRNEMVRVLLSVSQLDISSYDDVGEQVGGMYGLDVEDVFDTSKPFNLDEVITVISKIHNIDKYNNVEQSYEVKKERFYDLIMKTCADFNTFKTIDVMKFSDDEVEKSNLLLINGKFFSTPNSLVGKISQLPKADYTFLAYTRVKQTEGGKYKFVDINWNDSERYRVGDIVEAVEKRVKKGLMGDTISTHKSYRLKALDAVEVLYSGYEYAVMEVKASNVLSWSNRMIEVSEATLVGTTKKRRPKKDASLFNVSDLFKD